MKSFDDIVGAQQIATFLEHLRPISMLDRFAGTGRVRTTIEYAGDYTVASMREWLSRFYPDDQLHTDYEGIIYVDISE
jgi:hypothetical protein